MKKLKTTLQSRYLFKILGIIFLLYSFLMIYHNPIHSHYSIDTKEISGTVTKYKIDGDLLTIRLKGKETVMINYYFASEEEKNYYEENLKLGDQLQVTGTFTIPSNNTVPNLFNYKKYLEYHKIFYLVSAERIERLANNTSILYYIKNKIIERIDKIDKTGYLRTFILGDKSILSSDMIDSYQENGISHLFSISGMHVSLIVGILLFLLDKISYHLHYKYTIVIIVLLFYLFLTDFSASIIRTSIMFILSAINKCFNLKIKKLDIMLLTLCCAILYNPFIICDVGFQFSYVISLSLVLWSKRLGRIKNKLLSSLYTSFICFVVSFPICIYHFYQVNVLAIFLNIIMIPFVSVVVFPFTLITFFIPIIYPIYQKIILVLEKINLLVGNIKFFELILAKPSLVVILGYYIVILLTLLKKRYFILLMIIILLHKNYPYFDSKFMFTMIDVGQGDSLFIKLPYNKGNILIDTGGKTQYEKEKWQKRETTSSLAEDKIIPYLKSLGITHLDYLITTHGDYDHAGEAKNLINDFKIDKVIFNHDDTNELENELIQILTQKNIKYYKGIKEIKIDKYQFQFLNTKEYDNENDNSNVIYFVYNNYKFLFMGDAGEEREKDILENYHLRNIDFFKVGHHGSDTSSNEEFINKMNPKYSFISVGKNNRYGHPKASVLNILSNSKIYRTDIDGSVEIKFKKCEYQIRTYEPYEVKNN